jgi:hypothetical protein
MSARVKHKAAATWLALLAGIFGLHRFYLHGFKDGWGWLFPLPTLLGLAGVPGRPAGLGADPAARHQRGRRAARWHRLRVDA